MLVPAKLERLSPRPEKNPPSLIFACEVEANPSGAPPRAMPTIRPGLVASLVGKACKCVQNALAYCSDERARTFPYSRLVLGAETRVDA